MPTEIEGLKVATLQSTNQKNEGSAHILDAFRRTLVAPRIRERGPNNNRTVLGPYAANKLWDAWPCYVKRNVSNEKWSMWYNEALYSAPCGHSFFKSQRSYLGLVDGLAQVGDLVGVILVGQVPFTMHERTVTTDQKLLRRANSTQSRYELVGEW